MSILKYFQTSLPNPEKLESESALYTTSANLQAAETIDKRYRLSMLKLTGGKKKAYTAFSDEDRVKICCREWKQQCAEKNLSNRINKNAIMKHSQNIFDA